MSLATAGWHRDATLDRLAEYSDAALVVAADEGEPDEAVGDEQVTDSGGLPTDPEEPLIH